MPHQALAGTSQCNLTNWAFLSTDSKLTLSNNAGITISWKYFDIIEIKQENKAISTFIYFLTGHENKLV